MIQRLSTVLLSCLPASSARSLVKSCLPVNGKKQDGKRQLLVDVSEIIKQDARTGIQRVVRGILCNLMANPPEGYRVRPVFAERDHAYRYVSVKLPSLHLPEFGRKRSRVVIARSGDIFLGLDLAAHLLPRRQAQLLRWQQSGVRICVVVYDLLPLLHPHWFKVVRQKTFQRWLRTLAIFADDLICISQTVKEDLQLMLTTTFDMSADLPRMHVIPLGADIESSMPSTGCTAEERDLLQHLQQQKFVLMVGTLEPRKGYADALDAFEKIWGDGSEIVLVIVGKPGWQTDRLQQRLWEHPEFRQRLYWFENASDEMLDRLYRLSFGVLLASEAEGFGLPLVEAQHYGKPVLARNLAVYKELGDAGVTFFSQTNLAATLVTWLAEVSELTNRRCTTWCETAQKVSEILLQVQTQ
jgi:glycosyltransferase involved in cell wall biosynthesis